MRALRHFFFDIDRQLEDAARAKQQLDAERWRTEFRPGVMRLFAARTAKLRWSRALLEALVEELYPDDLFTELVGHSWRRDGLAPIARRLRISLTTTPLRRIASISWRPGSIASRSWMFCTN